MCVKQYIWSNACPDDNEAINESKSRYPSIYLFLSFLVEYRSLKLHAYGLTVLFYLTNQMAFPTMVLVIHIPETNNTHECLVAVGD